MVKVRGGCCPGSNDRDVERCKSNQCFVLLTWAIDSARPDGVISIWCLRSAAHVGLTLAAPSVPWTPAKRLWIPEQILWSVAVFVQWICNQQHTSCHRLATALPGRPSSNPREAYRVSADAERGILQQKPLTAPSAFGPSVWTQRLRLAGAGPGAVGPAAWLGCLNCTLESR